MKRILACLVGFYVLCYSCIAAVTLNVQLGSIVAAEGVTGGVRLGYGVVWADGPVTVPDGVDLVVYGPAPKPATPVRVRDAQAELQYELAQIDRLYAELRVTAVYAELMRRSERVRVLREQMP
jgi:hypothetical protein